MAVAEERRTYSVPEFARLAGISRGHAFELAKRGELPGAIRLGQRVVVVKTIADRFLSGEDVTTAA